MAPDELEKLMEGDASWLELSNTLYNRAPAIVAMWRALECALDEREQEYGRLPDGAPHWSVRARTALAAMQEPDHVN